MKGLGFGLLLLLVFSCSNNKSTTAGGAEEATFNYESFADHYTSAKVPYQLSDTALLNNKDTARMSETLLGPFIADSIKKKLFGKTTGIRYIPLRKIEDKKGESYFITKVVSGGKTAALLTVFGKAHDSAASLPFLIPDKDAATTQVSVIDNAYSISRNVTQRDKNDVIIEGKNVYAYNAAINGFTLVLTDVLDDSNQELVNPIDTFPRRHPFAGDYGSGKKNLVSIRDGRNESELNVFVHIEKEDGDCTGELKGTLFMTSTTTAVYRQGGDPCVLEFRFSPKAVTLREEEGCGSHRGLTCHFDGSYPRHQPAKEKGAKKPRSKK
jgi:hypothetical protein